MSWQIELPLIVRMLINDLSDPPTYSDERLLQTLAVAAKYVQFDVSLDNTYAVNVTTSTITPDPTGDDIFVGLLCLKSACIVDQSVLRTKAAMEGIRASLGPASLSVGGSLGGLKMILEQGPCALYEELTSHWDIKNATAIKVIFGPFVGNNFDPRYLQSHGYRSKNFFS